VGSNQRTVLLCHCAHGSALIIARKASQGL
jgi:hypothetical protein